MRKIGYPTTFSRPIRLSLLVVLLGIAFAIMMILLWTVALAAPPIEENPISVEGPTAIPGTVGVIRAVTAADLDNNGHPDLAFGQDNQLKIQQNTGLTTTQWAPAVTVGSTTYDLRDVQAVDLDRDGAMDLVSASADDAGHSQLCLWQNPTSPFASPWTVINTLTTSVSISLTTVASADLDGNGTPDLVSGGLDNVLRLWSNPLTGTQGFTTAWPSPATISTSGDQIRQVLIADIDLDGRPDIIEVADNNDGSGAVRLWQNPGDPFNTPWTVNNTLSTSAAQSLGVGDLDNDGDLDVVTGLANGQVIAWRNPLAGAFSTGWGSRSVGNLSLSIVGLVLTDADHDGLLDVVATGSGTPSTLVGWRNPNPDDPFGTDWPPVTIGTPSDATLALTAADFNRDGDDDFVTGTDTGSLQFWTNFLIRSSVRFEVPNIPAPDDHHTADALSGIGLHAMDVHDMDRDGQPDIVVATLGGSLILLQNNGSPFVDNWPSTTIGTSFGFFSVAVGDLDGDGWPDIATSTTRTDTGGQVHVWQNDGTPFTGAWASQTAETFPRQVMDLALGDIGREGHLQIVASTGITTTFHDHSERDVPASDDNAIWLLRPPTSGPFTSTWISSTVCTTTYSANGVALGDLDNDGWLDVVFGTDHASGAGLDPWPDTTGWPDAYQVRACHNLGNNPYSPAGWQDYDVGRDDAPVSVTGPGLPPGGGHTFWGAHVWGVAVGDFNNDGHLDVVSGGGAEGDYQILVYQNDGTPFDGSIWEPTAVGYGTRPDGGEPSCPGTYPEDCPWIETSVPAVNVGDLNDDGCLDIVSGFGYNFTIMPIWFNTGTPFGETVTDTHWIRYDLSVGDSRPVYGVEAADLDSDGRLDVASVTSWNPLFSPASGPLRVRRNLGGIARHDFQRDYSLTTIENGSTESHLSFAVTNNGRPYDHDLEIDYLKIHFADDNSSQDMENDQAQVLFQSLQIYRDANGDSVWQPSDSPVVTVTTFSFSDGYQTFTFPSGDPLAAISPGQTVTYFVVLEMQPTASQPAYPWKDNRFQMDYTPHNALLVRDRVTQAPVSIEEGAWTYTLWIYAVPAPAASVAMTAYPSAILADGNSTSTITATVTTAYSYPVLDGTQITFTTSAGSLPASPYVVTTTNGIATAVLTSSTELTTAIVTGTVSITATGTVPVVNFGPPDHITVSPSEDAISPGETIAYTVEAFDEGDYNLGDVTDSTVFTISPEAGGSWTDNVYTAEVEGTWTVTGTCSGKSDTAILHVSSNASGSRVFLPLITKGY